MVQREIDGPEPYDIPSELDEQVTAMIDQTERDIVELRVNLGWGKTQVAVINRAAALLGMPYQTYVQQAAFRQAIADLEKVASVAGDLIERSEHRA